MSDTPTTLPADAFSRTLRQFTDNPGAVRAGSTVNLIDFYGRSETWIVDTFRVEGAEVVFLQRVSAEGGMRLVIPQEVTAAMSRQRDRATGAGRRRGARQAVATRIARGDTLGNPDALRKARGKRRSRKAVR